MIENNEKNPIIVDSNAITQDEKMLAVLAHVLSIVAGFIPALVIYFIAKPEQVFLKENAKEALNFQISVTIASVITFFLMIILIGFLILPFVLLANIILSIIAAIKANDLQIYKYPSFYKFF